MSEVTSRITFYIRRPFAVMLVLLLGLAVISAFEQALEFQELPLKNAVVVAALVLGVYGAETGPRMRRIALALGLLGLIVEWLTAVADLEGWERLHNLPLVILWLYVVGVAFAHVVRTERVTADKIFGAICVYLLLASLWAVIYELLYESLGAEAFSFGAELQGREDVRAELFYFSWVTLTTLGYGDISPTHPLTRAFANFETIVGQFYLVVTVARLVALQVTQGPHSSKAVEGP